MAVYSVIYLMFGMILLICPEAILNLINLITDWLGADPRLGTGSHPFWAYVTVSLLFLLAVLCFLAFKDVTNQKQLIWLMIFAKYVSVLSQLCYYGFSADHPPGFVIGALTDFILGTVALVFLVRAGPVSTAR